MKAWYNSKKPRRLMIIGARLSCLEGGCLFVCRSLQVPKKSSSPSVPAGKGTSFTRAVKLPCRLSARLKAVPFPLSERLLRIVDGAQSEEYSVLPTGGGYAQRI